MESTIMNKKTCKTCGSTLTNDVYGSSCEDCWALRQPSCEREPLRRSGRRGMQVDSEAQYDHGLKGWRWIDVWSRRYEDA